MKSNRWKKLLLYTAIGIISLIPLLYIARPLYLPDAYLIRRLQKVVSSTTGLQLSIERGEISLQKGAVLEGIILEDFEKTITVSLKELRISYRFLPLLTKRLVVEELVLVDPTININKSEVQTDIIPVGVLHPLKQGIPDPIAAPASAPKKSLKSTIEFTLPFDAVIENLKVINTRLDFYQTTSDGFIEVSIGGINLAGRDIYLHEENNSRVQVTIDISDSLRLKYVTSNTHLDCESGIEFSTNAAVRLDHSSINLSLSTKSQVKAASKKVLFPEVKLSAKVRLENLQNLEVRDINLSFGNAVAIAAAFKAQDVFNTSAFQAELIDGQLGLEAVLLVLDDIFGLFPHKSFVELPRLTGRLFFQKSQLFGILTDPDPELKGTLRCRFDDMSFQDPSVGLSVANLKIDAFAEGQFSPLTQFSCNLGIDLRADSLQVPDGPLGRSLTVSPLSMGVSAEIKPGMMSPKLSGVWQGGTSIGGDLIGSISCYAQSLDLQNPHLSQGLLVEAGCSLDSIELNELFANDLNGSLSVAADFSVKSLEEIALSIGAFCPNLLLESPEGELAAPPLLTRIEMQASILPDFSAVEIPTFQVDLSPYGQIDFSASLRENQLWEVKNANLDIDLKEIAPVVKPFLSGPAEEIVMRGKVAVSGSCKGRGSVFDDDFQSDFQMKSEELYLSLPEQAIAFDSVQFQADFKGNRRNVDVTSAAEIRRLNLHKYRLKPYEAVAVNASIRFRNFRDFAGGSADVSFDDLGLDVRIDAQPSTSSRSPLGSIDITYRFESADSVYLLQNLIASGWSEGWCNITFPADTITQAKGVLNGKELRLFNREDLALSGLEFRLPFNTELHTGAKEISLISTERELSPFDDQVLFNNFRHLDSPEQGLGLIKCRNIHVGNYEFSNLDALIELRQSTIRIPRLSVDAYGGTIRSTFALGFPSLDPDAVQYRARIAGIGLNSTKLPGARPEEGEESEISAFAHFKGQGLNPNSHFDLEGGLDITQIGRKVADNILRFLDPDQSDPSIQTYRNYIKRGWSVKVFSFDVKEDFVYVSITPARPPITQLDMFLLSHLVGLGKSVTFGRLPLRYFLGQIQ